MSVLKGDEEKIIDCAKKMGIDVSRHHGQLLSCMIAAKPWSAVKRGLVNPPDEVTRSKEADELRRNVSLYFNDISKILATVDRQLLLVMKTNDLIRSIAYTLGNDERRSFLIMTRACFQMFQDKRYYETWNPLIKFYIALQSKWFYFRLYFYSFYLWLTWSPSTISTSSKSKLYSKLEDSRKSFPSKSSSIITTVATSASSKFAINQ